MISANQYIDYQYQVHCTHPAFDRCTENDGGRWTSASFGANDFGSDPSRRIDEVSTGHYKPQRQELTSLLIIFWQEPNHRHFAEDFLNWLMIFKGLAYSIMI